MAMLPDEMSKSFLQHASDFVNSAVGGSRNKSAADSRARSCIEDSVPAVIQRKDGDELGGRRQDLAKSKGSLAMLKERHPHRTSVSAEQINSAKRARPKPGGSGFKPQNTLHSSIPTSSFVQSASKRSFNHDLSGKEQEIRSQSNQPHAENGSREWKRRRLDLDQKEVLEISSEAVHPASSRQRQSVNHHSPSKQEHNRSHDVLVTPTLSSQSNSSSSQPFDTVLTRRLREYDIASGIKRSRNNRRRSGDVSDAKGSNSMHSSNTHYQQHPPASQERPHKRQRVSIRDAVRPSIDLANSLNSVDQVALSRDAARQKAVRTTSRSASSTAAHYASSDIKRKQSPSLIRDEIVPSKPSSPIIDTPLARRFKRDEIADSLIPQPSRSALERNEIIKVPRTMKQKDRMKQTSILRVGPSYDVKDALEEDELAGDNLITSKLWRNEQLESGSGIDIHQPSRHPRASKSYSVYLNDNLNSSKQVATRQSTNKTDVSDHKKTMAVRIKSYSSEHFRSNTSNMSLDWDDGARDFLLHVNGSLQESEHLGQVVCLIGSSRFLWYYAKDVTTVCVAHRDDHKTPINIVVVDFEDMHGEQICLEKVADAWPGRLLDKCISVDHLQEIIDRHLPLVTTQPPSDLERSETVQRHPNPRSKKDQPQSNGDDSHTAIEITESPQDGKKATKDLSNDGKANDEAPINASRGFLAQENNRRSTRRSQPLLKRHTSPVPERWSHAHKLQPWSRSLVYPKQGTKRVTVDFHDLERLDEGEFLNDNLIAFALRRIEAGLSTEWTSKVHFFNTFFYTSLSAKQGVRGFNYDAVKKWTKNMDLLSTPYIVVPINHDLHWFVAIICNLPNLQRELTILGNDDDAIASLKQKKVDSTPQAAKTSSPMLDSSPLAKTSLHELGPAQEKLRQLSLTDIPAEREQPAATRFDNGGKISESTSSQQQPSSVKRGYKKRVGTPRTFDANQPAILMLDSLALPHSAEVAILKDYVIAEANEKRQISVVRQDLQGVNAKGLPEQNNYCDCGIYLISYLEAFAQDPRSFVAKIMSKTMSAEKDFSDFDPFAKRKELREALLTLSKEQHVQKVTKPIDAAQPLSKKDEEQKPPESIVQDGRNLAQSNQDQHAAAEIPLASTEVSPAQDVERVLRKTAKKEETQTSVRDTTNVDRNSSYVPESPPLPTRSSFRKVSAEQSQEPESEPPRPYPFQHGPTEWSFNGLDS